VKMRAVFKCGQWVAFFVGCPFLMIGSGLMWCSAYFHDKALVRR
jgi:hypothetical protein